MSISNYILFTTPSCVSCVPVKNYLNELGLNGIFIDASEGDGKKLALENNVRSVPVVYFYDSENNELGIARSVTEIKELVEKLNISTDKKEDPMSGIVSVYSNKETSTVQTSIQDTVPEVKEEVPVETPKPVEEFKPVENKPTSFNNKVELGDGAVVYFKQIDPSLPIPEYKTEGSAGLDLYVREKTVIPPLSLGFIPCNVIMKTPKNYMLGLFARSSTPLRKGLTAANGAGVVDSDYCGEEDELKFFAYNFRNEPVTVEKGERIAQAVFIKISQVNLKQVDRMDSVSRGGFGSTGVN